MNNRLKKHHRLIPSVLRTSFLGIGLILGATAHGVNFLSVNIVEFLTDAQSIDADETYGVPALGTVTGGWLNTQLAPVDPLPWETGAASTVSLTYNRPNGPVTLNAAYADTPLIGGVDHYTGTVNNIDATFTNLNANFPNGYFAVAYVAGFNGNDGASISDGTTTYYYQPVDFRVDSWDGTLVQTTETADLGSGNAPIAQYAVFGSVDAPLTADTLTISLDTLYGGGSALGGLQIVAVPEPATTVLLSGFAVLAFLLYRRRK